jgi:hypothetical protein
MYHPRHQVGVGSMRFVRSRWMMFFAAFLALQAWHQAQAFRAPFPGKVNNALVRVVQQRATRMGLASADPRIAATVAGFGAAATDLAVSAGLALAVGTPIGWGGIILSGILGAGIYCYNNGCSLSFEKDASGMIIGKGAAQPALRPGSQAWYNAGSNCFGSSIDAVAACHASTIVPITGWGAYTKTSCSTSAPITCTFTSKPTDKTKSDYTRVASFSLASYANEVCNGGAWKNGKCFDAATAAPSVAPQEFVENVPQEDLDKPASPDLMARVANRLWRDAANKPGYAGLPYTMADPVTSAEMDKLRQEHPETWPDLSDMTAPAGSGVVAGANPMPQIPLPANGTKTETDTGYVPAPQTGTNPSTEPLSNLGSDPGTAAPDATAQTPTASSILDPIFDFVPSVMTPDLHIGAGECPRPTAVIFAKTYTVESHCALVESYRAMISATMLAVWALAACLIVLRA